KIMVRDEDDHFINVTLLVLGIVGQDKSDATFFIAPEDQRTISERGHGRSEQHPGAQILVSSGDFRGRVEGGDALGGVKASGGGLDLKNLALLHADEEVAATVGVGGVDPIDG